MHWLNLILIECNIPFGMKGLIWYVLLLDVAVLQYSVHNTILAVSLLIVAGHGAEQ